MQAPEDIDFENECEAIRQERETYSKPQNYHIGIKVLEWLSIAFLFSGFITLILMPFTEITLLNAACLFVIHHTLSPTDLERTDSVLKGIAEDMGYIRANISVIRKRINE